MSDYINGIFIETKESQYGKYLHASVKVEDFIKALRQLPVSDKGYISFAITPQKDNKNKFSCKPYKQKEPTSPQSNSGNDLPF